MLKQKAVTRNRTDFRKPHTTPAVKMYL